MRTDSCPTECQRAHHQPPPPWRPVPPPPAAHDGDLVVAQRRGVDVALVTNRVRGAVSDGVAAALIDGDGHPCCGVPAAQVVGAAGWRDDEGVQLPATDGARRVVLPVGVHAGDPDTDGATVLAAVTLDVAAADPIGVNVGVRDPVFVRVPVRPGVPLCVAAVLCVATGVPLVVCCGVAAAVGLDDGDSPGETAADGVTLSDGGTDDDGVMGGVLDGVPEVDGVPVPVALGVPLVDEEADDDGDAELEDDRVDAALCVVVRVPVRVYAAECVGVTVAVDERDKDDDGEMVRVMVEVGDTVLDFVLDGVVVRVRDEVGEFVRVTVDEGVTVATAVDELLGESDSGVCVNDGEAVVEGDCVSVADPDAD